MTITAPSFLWLYAMIGLLYIGMQTWNGFAQECANRTAAHCQAAGIPFHPWQFYVALLIIGAAWPVFMLTGLGRRR